MSVKYKELEDFTRKIEDLNKQQKEEFMKACCKELAARLLEKVIKRTKPGNYSKEIEVTAKRDSKYHKKGDKYKKKVTPKKGGTLRRGWTAETYEEAVNGNGNGKKPEEYANSMKIDRIGNTFKVEIINPVEYAAYVEYGHRKRNHQGWVPGKFMLTISEAELRTVTPQILERKLQKFLEDAMNDTKSN